MKTEKPGDIIFDIAIGVGFLFPERIYYNCTPDNNISTMHCSRTKYKEPGNQTLYDLVRTYAFF
jgi:hypothetical protein